MCTDHSRDLDYQESSSAGGGVGGGGGGGRGRLSTRNHAVILLVRCVASVGLLQAGKAAGGEIDFRGEVDPYGTIPIGIRRLRKNTKKLKG